MKRTLTPLLILLVLLQATPSFTQSWQWGKRGGGNSQGMNVTPEDEVMDMATDKNGNVYILSLLETNGSEDIDGQQYNGFGNKDMLLSSFKCDGTLRWKKAIGSPADDPMNDFPYSLRADTAGHVYVSGNIYPYTGTAGFDTDSLLPSGYSKTMFLVQYDTSGNFGWLRMPQPDTMQFTNSNQYRNVDFDVDNAGNVYWLCIMPPCQIAGSTQSIPAQGAYILKYNALGGFQSFTALQMQANTFVNGSFFTSRIARDKNNGRFYLAGWYQSGTLSMGGQPITNSGYIGAFDNSGNFLWKREGTGVIAFAGRIAIDNSGSIYAAGSAKAGAIFNGYTVVNTLMTTSTLPVIVKLNASGTNAWAKNGSVNGATGGVGIALSGNKVFMTGDYPGTLTFGGTTTLNHIQNQGYDAFLAGFDIQNGNPLVLDSIGSPFGYYDAGTALTSDNKGNIYVGGRFQAQVTVASNILNNSGGPSDFFIAKYGSANCTCTTPVSSYTFNAPANSAIAAFTYNGTSPYDSLRWDFGDGGTSTSATPTHTYASTGTYNVCVTVYNPCGSDTKCQTVSVTVGIDEVQVLDEITIYPNPVSNKLTINGAAGATAELYNVMGSKVYTGKLSVDNAEISTSSLPAGSYILQLTTSEGHRKTIKLAKD
ncbi:PKD domain-containing protein [Polluticoccus soli]|uniref:PKD domain-containing protein n=1 Tax=Polluticoccus soli TaxID=3034150 RepID=UPI0023E1BCDA|nr:PKD domain-containing protein [Flavipsychrobacter sp. JY13-12]